MRFHFFLYVQVFFIELAFIRFHVHDAGSNHLMSQRAMPLTCLRPGYRHVRLRDTSNVPLELATLFIYSKITDTVVTRHIEQDLSNSSTPHLFRNRLLRRPADPQDALAVGSSDSVDVPVSHSFRSTVSRCDRSIKHSRSKSTAKRDAMKSFAPLP